MEAEVRAILMAAVDDERPRSGLFTALSERFSQLGGVELDLPARTDRPRGAEFDE